MELIKNDLEIRKQESENYVKSITLIENGDFTAGDSSINKTQLVTSMKASVLLMLYNAVESTITRCLSRLFDIISQDDLKYNELSHCLKKIVLLYYDNYMNKKQDPHERADIKFSEIETVNGRLSFHFSFDEISKHYQMYSGNLDARQIRAIFKKYGVDFEEECSETKTIKEDRNYLAHGEKSFEEVGREVSSQQLSHYQQKVFEYLTVVIDEFSNYVQNNKYKQ